MEVLLNAVFSQSFGEANLDIVFTLLSSLLFVSMDERFRLVVEAQATFFVDEAISFLHEKSTLQLVELLAASSPPSPRAAAWLARNPGLLWMQHALAIDCDPKRLFRAD